MADVFISYANEDRDRASQLARAFEARGWSVWWDRKIIAWQSFDQVIERELETAKSVVVLWSKDSISSEWVKNEAAAAAERSVLVPALIHNVKLPLEFRRKQTVDLIGWDGDLTQDGFQTLCNGVAAAITGSTPTAAPKPPDIETKPLSSPLWRLKWSRHWALAAILVTVIALGLGLFLISFPRQKAPTTTSTNILDYTAQMYPVRNNGNEGSAVGFAVAAALEYQIQKTFGERVMVSPRYIYYYARLDAGKPTDKDTGAYIRDAINVLQVRGTVMEEEWPYKAGEFAAKPPKGVELAKHYKISQAEPVRNINELKTALKKIGPVAGGITYYKSVLSREVSRTGKIRMPGPGETEVGGDAVCFVGFDDNQQLLKFQGHWGTKWGDNGYGYISYEYFNKSLREAWAMSMNKSE